MKMTLHVEEKGGAGSGHLGHAGRPGKHGGSVPGSIALSVRTGRTAASRQNEAKFLAAVEAGNYQTTDEQHNKGITNSQRVIVVGHGKVLMKEVDTVVYHTGQNAEVELYNISQELGWDIVPETAKTTLDENIGNMYEGDSVTIQSWVNNSAVI